MKNLVIYFITILSILIIPIYPQHIPPCQGGAHGGQGACWGYAVGRAFNRGWNDSRCPISTLNFNNVSSTYFTWYSPFNIDAVQVGDIIAWGLQGTVHVAYVTGIYFRTNDGIILADRQNYGSPERTNLTLSILITERGGSPDGYFRKKNLWSITVENDVEGIHNVGKVSISGGVYNGQYDSPKIANQLNWESNMSITAVFDGTSYNNYVRRFTQWNKEGDFISSSNSYSFSVINYNFNKSYKYDAVFNKECNIIFQNNFISVGHGGIIFVNGEQYNSPTNTFYIIEENSISASAIGQTINYIDYSFDHWSDGSTSANKTFYPNSHTTYTAYFIGHPNPTSINFGWDYAVNHPIKFHWTDNPNTAITQYKIWRKVRHDGIIIDTVLLATVGRGVQTFTDYDYMFTQGYIDDILWYDVRQYYSFEQTYSQEYWHSAYGQLMPKENGQNELNISEISNYKLNFFPNPFNPVTTIFYQVPKDGITTLKVFDLVGKEISTILNKYQSAGKYEINFDASNLSSGIYLCMLKLDDYVLVKKMLLVK